mgnify:CR=1 FL=1
MGSCSEFMEWNHAYGGRVMDVIKSDKGTNVGANIRRIRLESDIGQTDLVRILQLMGARHYKRGFG